MGRQPATKQQIERALDSNTQPLRKALTKGLVRHLTIIQRAAMALPLVLIVLSIVATSRMPLIPGTSRASRDTRSYDQHRRLRLLLAATFASFLIPTAIVMSIRLVLTCVALGLSYAACTILVHRALRGVHHSARHAATLAAFVTPGIVVRYVLGPQLPSNDDVLLGFALVCLALVIRGPAAGPASDAAGEERA